LERSSPNSAGPAPSALRLLTLAEVHDLTGWSVSHLRRQIRLRKLPIHRAGRSIRVSETDLAAFLARTRRASR
jgi:excisionase family DNA binding protein